MCNCDIPHSSFLWFGQLIGQRGGREVGGQNSTDGDSLEIVIVRKNIKYTFYWFLIQLSPYPCLEPILNPTKAGLSDKSILYVTHPTYQPYLPTLTTHLPTHPIYLPYLPILPTHPTYQPCLPSLPTHAKQVFCPTNKLGCLNPYHLVSLLSPGDHQFIILLTPISLYSPNFSRRTSCLVFLYKLQRNIWPSKFLWISSTHIPDPSPANSHHHLLHLLLLLFALLHHKVISYPHPHSISYHLPPLTVK